VKSTEWKSPGRSAGQGGAINARSYASRASVSRSRIFSCDHADPVGPSSGMEPPPAGYIGYSSGRLERNPARRHLSNGLHHARQKSCPRRQPAASSRVGPGEDEPTRAGSIQKFDRCRRYPEITRCRSLGRVQVGHPIVF
jgi:hypothetical protein